MEEKTKEKSEAEEEKKKLRETETGETKTEEKKLEGKKEKTAELKKQLAELTDLLQRTQANFENYRKQQEKRIEELQNLANKSLILQLLPVLDNFELVLKNTPALPKDFLKGMELINSQLFTLLESQGLKPIPTENQLFNPYLHEALLKVPSEQPENIILEEFQKGFLLNHQVIRPAKVKVSSGKAPEKTKNQEKNKENHQSEKSNQINPKEVN